ncbi:MAG: tryptophan-rich sensory protein [Bacilli bacterium]|nr:tryptophan-rich sensory protein [Bacilli bacterium]
MKINYKKLLIFILVPLSLGALVGILTTPNSNIDSILPPIVFPIVWTILYILMGVSSYLVYEETKEIPKIYIIQLIFNLLWSFVFFKFKLFTLAFIWILFLILLVILMIRDFLSKNKLAGYLQIPYLIWLFIAAILNLIIIL